MASSLSPDAINFLNSETFRARVRTIVGEDEYLKTLISSLRIELRIRDEVESKMKETKEGLDRLEQRVKDEIGRTIRDRVAGQISQQLPAYLDQNATMQGLLNGHKDRMEATLETKAREILKRIVEDPNYHEVNQAYFAAFKQDGDQAIIQIRASAAGVEAELKKQVGAELQSIATLRTKVGKLKDAVESQSTWQTVNFVLTLGLACACGYLFFTRK
jgi:uncharacterized protein (DUF2267 family)